LKILLNPDIHTIMKKGQLRFLAVLLVSIIFIVSSQSFAQTPITPPSPVATPSNNSSFFNTNFWQNVTVAALSAVLAFLSGYALAGIGKKQGSGKKLSYAILVEKGLVTIEKDVKEKVKVLYAGEEIENLYNVRCDVENTGTTVIKSQDIRFEFLPETRILDSSFDPVPQPEMKIEMINDSTLKFHEKKYRIGHIERNQSVGFRFTVTSTKDVHLELYPFNESGDVDFISRSVSKVDDEKEQVTKFLTLLIMYFVIPQSIHIISVSFLTDVIQGLVRLVILFFLFPLIVPFSRSVSNIISALSYDKEENLKSKYAVSIDVLETGGNLTVGDVTYKQ
jgi:hypothetical protein